MVVRVRSPGTAVRDVASHCLSAVNLQKNQLSSPLNLTLSVGMSKQKMGRKGRRLNDLGYTHKGLNRVEGRFS